MQRVQAEKALKAKWGKDADKQEIKIKPTFELFESLDEYVEKAGSADKALDFINDAVKTKAKQRITGKLSTYKNKETPEVVTKELLEVALVSPFVNLRGSSEATLVKNALSQILESAQGGQALTLEDIKAILDRTRATEAMAA